MKLSIFFLSIFLSISISAFCESPKDNLFLADSLFNQKKYTQSFELYEKILQNDKKSSAAMLLKMAFIKEGLGDFTNALYYLDLYHEKTYDKRVLKKMEILAKQHKLSGYDYDDAVFFLNMYHRYRLQIDFTIFALILLTLSFLIYKKRQNNLNPRFAGWVILSILVVLLIVNNFFIEHKRALISAPLAHLMNGPSPGSGLVDVATQGHRVEILGKEDVWVKISWKDQAAYIKSINLKQL